MSTLKATNIQHASAANPAIVLDASGGMSGSFPSPNRNLLMNGAMQVAQRGSSTASISTWSSIYYTADRWVFNGSSIGTHTQDIQNDAPSGSGLAKSFRVLCTVADAAPAAGDYLLVEQRLEGQDLQRIAKGTASAQQLTFSFWVKSNATGTYVVNLRDANNTRLFSQSYTISASATWEKKTITVPADTSGVLNNDNQQSLVVTFWLAAGTTYTSGSLQTDWGSTVSGNRAVGQTNLAAATSNYWQVTGVQLEVGTAATPFEFKSFGQELAECLRYLYMFQNSEMTFGSQRAFAFASNTNMMRAVIPFPVRMRAEPTLVSNSGTNYFVFYDGVTQDYFNALTLNASGLLSAEIYSDSNVAATQFRPGLFYTANASAYVGFSADL